MAEWIFRCGCGEEIRLIDEADQEQANAKAREFGWHVDWSGPYPGVACSQKCWQKSNDEWEARRPAREALHVELLGKQSPKGE